MSANDSKFECGCPACTCGVVDTGGTYPWGAPIMDLCRTCYGSGRVLVKGSSHPMPNNDPAEHKKQYDQLMSFPTIRFDRNLVFGTQCPFCAETRKNKSIYELYPGVMSSNACRVCGDTGFAQAMALPFGKLPNE